MFNHRGFVYADIFLHMTNMQLDIFYFCVSQLSAFTFVPLLSFILERELIIILLV
jgi:hypothetical protein